MSKRAQVVNLPPELALKIDLARPAVEQISASLRVAILNMTLEPGQIISEAELGNTFGASRTPVREAIALLRDQGLIVTLPSRGNFVSKLAIPEIKGSQFVRQSLEMTVAEYHCKHGLPDGVKKRIEENLKAQVRCVKASDGREFHLLDDRFHALLADAVGHSRIATIIEREKARLDRLRVLSLSSRENLSGLLNDHQQIFDAICARDLSVVRDRVERHLRRVLDTLSDLHAAHREYFDDE